MDKNGIKADQIQSGVYDGAYFHDSVDKYLNELLGVLNNSIYHCYDKMHKCGLNDKHLLKRDEFKWIVDLVDTVMDLVRRFRTGKNHFMLLRICERLERRLKHLATLPETRLANYKRVVLSNFLANLRPVILGLNEIQTKKCNGNTRDRKEADEAAKLRGKVFNKLFVIQLSGIVFYKYFSIDLFLQ